MAKDKDKKAKKNKGEKKETKTLRIELSDDVTDFSFKVSAKELEGGIGKVAAVLSAAGRQDKNFVLLAVKGKVVLIGYNPDTYVYVLMKTGEAEGNGNFGFLSNLMQGVVKGRNDMTFSFKGGDVSFKDSKSKYAGSFHTIEVSSDQINVVNMKFVSQAEKEEKDSKDPKKLKLHSVSTSILPRQVLDALKEGVALTSIKNIYNGETLLSFMQLDEKGILTVSAFDNHHFGMYRAKVDAGGMTFRAALPSSHFMIIERMVEGTKASFHVLNESVRVEGDGFALVLPATQSDPRNFASIPTFVKALPEPSMSARCSAAELNSLTENLFTLHSVNTAFELIHEKGSKSLQVKFKTTHGEAQDALKLDAKISKNSHVKLDPRLLRDLLGLVKSQSEFKISIIPNQVVRLDAKTKLDGVVSLMSSLIA